MALGIKHKKVSDKLDGGDPSLIQPSHWNEEHDIIVPGKALVGNAQAAEGEAEAVLVIDGSGLKLDPATKTLELESKAVATAEIVVAETPTEDIPEHRVLVDSTSVEWDKATPNEIKANLAEGGVTVEHLQPQERGGALIYGADGVAAFLPPTKEGEVLVSGTDILNARWGGTGAPHAVLRGTRATGVGDGSHPANAWHTRNLAVQIYDIFDMVNLVAGNAFQLPVGKYVVEWSAPGYRTGGFQSRLWNNTDDSLVGLGSSMFSADAADSCVVMSTGIVKFEVTTVTKSFIIQSHAKVLNANGCGLPSQSGNTEVYTWVKIWSMAAP